MSWSLQCLEHVHMPCCRTGAEERAIKVALLPLRWRLLLLLGPAAHGAPGWVGHLLLAAGPALPRMLLLLLLLVLLLLLQLVALRGRPVPLVLHAVRLSPVPTASSQVLVLGHSTALLASPDIGQCAGYAGAVPAAQGRSWHETRRSFLAQCHS